MRTAETAAALARFAGRGPGTDAERRAATWLAGELDGADRDAHIEPFWCRPSWALAHAWHVALALAGSLWSVSSPRVGGGLILVALVSMIADDLLGISLGRRMTPERASQNVVAPAPGRIGQGGDPERLRLIITTNYDAGRTGLVYRNRLRTAAARAKRAAGAFAPGWLAWLALAQLWLLAIAVLRLEGHGGTIVGVAQLPPTVALVLALALLIELATSGFGPAASDNASGAAVAVALARALDAAPPPRLDVDVVLQGAGDGGGIGLRRYLRARRRTLRPTDTIVLGIAACGAGRPRWWVSDGPLVPLRYAHRLRELCAGIAAHETGLEAGPHHGRGATPALRARAVRLPAITVGCLDERGLAPRSHQSSDIVDAIDPAALDAIVELALMLVDAIDGFFAQSQSRLASPSTPA